jgi:hypothetical protein
MTPEESASVKVSIRQLFPTIAVLFDDSHIVSEAREVGEQA